MNRFFRTAYASTLVYLVLTLFAVLIAGVPFPFPTFACLYFGLLLVLLPYAARKLTGREPLFVVLGTLTALLGFALLALFHSPLLYYPVHAMGILSAALFLSALRHRTTHSDFKAKYQFTVIMVLIVIGFVYLALLAGIGESGLARLSQGAVELAMNSIVPLAIVLLVTGVLHLRGLRAQEGVVDERAFNRRQLRDTLIFAALVTLVFAVDPFEYLKKALLFLINDMLRPAASVLAQMLGALLRLISCAPPTVQEVQPTPAPTPEDDPIPVAPLAETEPERYFLDGRDVSLTISYIFLGAAALILILIVALQIRKLIKKLRKRNKNRGRGYPHETREAIRPDRAAHRENQPKKRSADPRERMRYLYGAFLRYLRKVPIRIKETNTCGEIERVAKAGLHAKPSDLSDFTELYEKARYRQRQVVTDDDALRMKTLLGKIKR